MTPAGTEYVVDCVSRDGVHKVVAVWEYDKRAVNGAAFVYFGTKLRQADDKVVQALVDYQKKVLDALAIRNGPSHAEIKFSNGSPCLVEVGARCHGGEGTFVKIVERCIGYSQVSATIDAYLDPKGFKALPSIIPPFKAHGREATLVSYSEGVVASAPGLAEIEKMRSFVCKEIFVKPGDKLVKTVDMFTYPGSIVLVNEDEQALESDMRRIRELEVQGLYVLA